MSDKLLPKQVLIRLRADQTARLRAMAEADERSIAYFVRKAVDLYLAQEGATDGRLP